MRYLISGGGTGGHIYPALAIASALRALDRDAEFLYLGNQGKMEADLAPRAGLSFAPVTSAPLVGSPVRKGLNLLTTVRGARQALAHLKRFRPHAVVATGGYATGPVMLAARWAKRPLAVWEGNAFPGLTVRIGAKWARLVIVPFSEALGRMQTPGKTLVLPVPVRPAFYQASRAEGRASLGLGSQEQVILATGGSGGAEHFNRLVVGAASAILTRPGRVLVHVTGARYYKQVRQAYEAAGMLDGERAGRVLLHEYVHNMPEIMAAADLAISRAGASATGELIARGLPSVLIPSPNVTDNHQEFNARAIAERGAGLLLVEKGLTGERLAEAVLDLLGAPERLQQMSAAMATLAARDATERIAQAVIEMAQGGGER